MDTKQLERAVQDLPADEFAAFAAWFEEYLADRWDEELHEDITAGRLDGLAAKARSDFNEGRCKPL